MAIDFSFPPEIDELRLKVRRFIAEVVRPAEAKIAEREGDRRFLIQSIIGEGVVRSCLNVMPRSIRPDFMDSREKGRVSAEVHRRDEGRGGSQTSSKLGRCGSHARGLGRPDAAATARRLDHILHTRQRSRIVLIEYLQPSRGVIEDGYDKRANGF